MSTRRTGLAATLVTALVGLGGQAWAHPVTVDGSASDWLGRQPMDPDVGLIARAGFGTGEYVWRDSVGDRRTGFEIPTSEAEDITSVRITGDTSNLYILVTLAAGPNLRDPMVQVALDLDRVANSGQSGFAGGADTAVAADARWEYLVQTRFETSEPPALLNTGFSKVADVQGKQSGGTIELAVPWTALGFSTVPTVPLRFTIATFRSDLNSTNVVELSGSDAIDVVTDYGDPGEAGRNTWLEVGDGIVNYSFDVFFDSTGNVYAPLLVTRFVSASVDTEWVMLQNVSPSAYALSGVKLGDEERANGTEGMASIPGAVVLAAGARFVVAQSGTAYHAAFGAFPGAEWTATHGSVPDTTPFAAWASGAVNLANAGDEVLVLDRSNTILDVVTFGSGAYGGVTSLTPAPGQDEVIARKSSNPDTDNNQDDFNRFAKRCASNADCGGCATCNLNACEPRPAGASCGDGNMCNGAETCDGAGTCTAGTPPDCSDSNVCTKDLCDPATGCSFANEPAGTSCADSNECNGEEQCDGAGACKAGSPPTCSDNNPCTADSCVIGTGCVHAQMPAGSSCSDGNACNGSETCNAAGTCVSGVPLICFDGNPCTTDTCSPALGCQFPPQAVGFSCADSDPCNGVETCNAAGMCANGTPLVCNDLNPCTSDSCVVGVGCQSAPVAAGTSCSDGNLCNGDEKCGVSGVCQAGSAIDCDDKNPCTLDSCSPLGGCSHTPMAAGSSCSDGNVCNGAEVCSASGTCATGSPLVCNDNNACTTDSCDATLGCRYQPKPQGTACPDGNVCNGNETCNASGTCTAGAALVCSDGNPCTLDGCTPSQGCSYSASPKGASCSDGDACNGVETCDGTGVCEVGPALNCNDSNPCTTDSCSADTGCVNAKLAQGTLCDDGNVCNGSETCDANGVCGGGMSLNCDDGNPCTVDTCSSTQGCQSAPSPSGSSCEDTNFCNGKETCDGAGNCVAGAPPTCEDNNPCTSDSCDVTGGCMHIKKPSGISCSDNNVCNGLETCNANAFCMGGTPLNCNDDNRCTKDDCDPSSGCTFTHFPAGTPCGDGDPCNGIEACDGQGTCLVNDPPDGGQCVDGGADAADGEAGIDSGPDSDIDSSMDAPDTDGDLDAEASADDVVETSDAAEVDTGLGGSGGGAGVGGAGGGAGGQGASGTGGAFTDAAPDPVEMPADLVVDEQGGCGCRSASQIPSGLGAAAMGIMMALAAARRRKR